MAIEEVLNIEEALSIDEAAPSAERLKIVRRVLFIASLVLLISMIFVGLRIFVGYILGCLASVSLVTALTCRWQRIRSFLYLILFTVLIAIIYSMIHVEVLTRVVTAIFGDAVVDNIGWKIFNGLASNILLFFVPACGLVGIVGSTVLYTRRVIERVKNCT
jgi:hypothetical protein